VLASVHCDDSHTTEHISVTGEHPTKQNM